jgi:Bifunctional DNA primase/polymerase, N-terminal
MPLNTPNPERGGDSAMIAAALWWATRGFSVFPALPRDKKPFGKLVPQGLKNASNDPTVIKEWWRLAPDANIAVAIPAGMFVIDLDGEAACDNWLALGGKHGAPPPTLTVITGRGKHLYFRSSVEVRNSTGRIGPGIDTRGPGGYTIAPPSVHSSGAVYLLDRRCLEVAEAPRWLVDMALPEVEVPPPRQAPLVVDRHHKAAIDGILLRLMRARAGERNALTFWAACKFRDRGVPCRAAIGLIAAAASHVGLPPRETERTVRSAFIRGAS